MANRIIDVATIAAPLGAYSQAIASGGAGTWLHIAGQVGVDANGRLAEGFEAQAHQAWSNLVAVLSSAGMQVGHLVKVSTFLARPSDLPLLGPVRAGFMGDARPASTVLIVQALARPEWLVEVEGTAFLPDSA
ncbi:RidA family protein [Bordetella petrii]|uniref:RidA family protein n=1 Tax=Bordetella petrii TaxID=94624 RepID=UPI001E4C5D9B|nr:RidA family protein [Bordetella petrii]MCD0502738.1 RidA family protein [Bordetella petrii]